MHKIKRPFIFLSDLNHIDRKNENYLHIDYISDYNLWITFASSLQRKPVCDRVYSIVYFTMNVCKNMYIYKYSLINNL